MRLLCRGSGPPVLFIHGLPTSNRLWSGIISRLCGKFTCFAVDLPGLGDSPPETYRRQFLQNLAGRIEQLRIESKIDRWHIVGHDAGSAVAVHYAHAYQRYVSRLVLLAPAIFPDLKPYYLLELLRKPIVGEAFAPVVSALFWNLAMRRALRNEDENSAWLDHDFRRPFLGFHGSWRFMRVMRWGKPAEVLAEVPRFLPQLLMPTLILYGSRDPAVPRAFAHRASSLIPNSRLEQVESGHFIPLNRPVFVAERLEQFLASS